jgi:antitoxin ChpS
VRISAENGRVVFEPRIRPHYTLAELLAKSHRKALKPSLKNREWLNGGPVGKEGI